MSKLDIKIEQGPVDQAPGQARGANAIAARLRHAIESGVYGDGDKLPPERDLATSFGAARSTVRKALDQLEAEHFVVRRVGSGTFVSYLGPLHGESGEIVDLMSPLQLVEARMAVEPYVARLAALHASQRDLAMMESVLERLEAEQSDKDAFTRLDGEFHLAIARAARNPLLLQVLEQINHVRTQALWNSAKERVLSVEQIAAYNAQHRAIFESLCRRDNNGVVTLMKEHLTKARHDLVGAESS